MRTIASAVGFMHGLYRPEMDGEELFMNETGFWSGDDSQMLPCDSIFERRVSDSKKILNKVHSFFQWERLHPLNLLTIGDFFMAARCSNNSYNEIVTDELYG
jgi:hypothetical protein